MRADLIELLPPLSYDMPQLYNNQLSGTLPQTWGTGLIPIQPPGPPPPAPPPLPPTPPTTTSLVLYLALDNNGFSPVATPPSTGVAVVGALNYSAGGMVGPALSFNWSLPPATTTVVPAPTSYILANTTVATASTAPWSIALWVYLDPALAAASQTAVSLFSGTAYPSATGGGFALQFDPATNPGGMTALLYTTPNAPLMYPSVASLAGVWTHVAVTVTAPTAAPTSFGTALLYMNNALFTSATFTTGLALASPKLLVGGLFDGTQGFSGSLDEVWVVFFSTPGLAFCACTAVRRN